MICVIDRIFRLKHDHNFKIISISQIKINHSLYSPEGISLLLTGIVPR